MNTMECGAVKINFTTKTFNLITSSSPLNRHYVSINFSKRFKKCPIGKPERNVSWTGFDPAAPLPVSQICLTLSCHEFTPYHLFSLINDPLNNTHLSKFIAKAIAARANLSIGILHSMVTSVEVVITQKLFSVTPVSCLAKEGTRQGEDQSTCPICLEELVNDEGNKIRKLPHCLHEIHKECLNEWITSPHSCPLCRTSELQERQ